MPNNDENFKIVLTSVSPIAFSFAKVGDVLEVRKKLPKTNEFRGEKIGAASVSYLIFKGITKLGMIPTDFVTKNENLKIKRRCKLTRLDQASQLIEIEFIY